MPSLCWGCGVTAAQFDYNLLHLQAKGTESVVWENRLLEDSDRSSWYAVSTANSSAELHRKKAQCAALPVVEHVESLASLLPTNQEERLALIAALAPLVASVSGSWEEVAPLELDDLGTVLKKIRPRSWRRPPQQPISQVEDPKCLRKWGFWDSPCHSEWPKVADAVIKAHLVRQRWRASPRHTSPPGREAAITIPILPAGTDVPWHRVINHHGHISLRTPVESPLVQRLLLEEEGVVFDAEGRVDLAVYRWQGQQQQPLHTPLRAGETAWSGLFHRL